MLKVPGLANISIGHFVNLVKFLEDSGAIIRDGDRKRAPFPVLGLAP